MFFCVLFERAVCHLCRLGDNLFFFSFAVLLTASALSGPGVSLKWQEEVKLNETLLSALLPVVDGATGKLSTRGMSDFFNTKMLDPTSKVRGANNLVLEKVTCATEAASQMAAYAEKSSAAVSDKLTVILKDWAKVKTAYYDMDNKIAQVRIYSVFSPSLSLSR